MSGPGTPSSVPQGASPDTVPPSARALRDRLEVARRHVQQLQAGGQNVAQQSNQAVAQPNQVAAPKATIGQPGAGAGTAGRREPRRPALRPRARPRKAAARSPRRPRAAARASVVIADKRQTFQQMLGLK